MEIQVLVFEKRPFMLWYWYHYGNTGVPADIAIVILVSLFQKRSFMLWQWNHYGENGMVGLEETLILGL